MTLLDVRQLVTVFETSGGPLRAVDEVSFTIERGETVGLVGESGSGKSVTALSLLRLLSGNGRILSGAVLWEGRDLLKVSAEEMRDVRGSEIAMIFQDPMTSLNPLLRIGDQVMEGILLHRKGSEEEARRAALELLERVRLPDAKERFRDYPHQFSGGQRQRIMIAIALACRPKLLIADEPTTALDVTVQRQVLDLLRELQDEFGMALLLITHDLGVVHEVAERCLLMYAGRLVEDAPAATFFTAARHPYAKGLLNSLPNQGRPAREFSAIPGNVPVLGEWARGCRFSPRCSYVVPACQMKEPTLDAIAEGHRVRCFEWEKVN